MVSAFTAFGLARVGCRLKGFERGGKLQLAQQVYEPILMGRLDVKGGRIEFHRTIELDGRQLPAEPCIVSLFDE